MNKSQALFKRDTNCLSDVMKLRFYPFVAERGEGAVLYDVDGKKYLDFNAGWGVANTGYNHPRIVKAVCDQMSRLSFVSTISVLNEKSIELAEALTKLTPGNFHKKVWYGHSGSDANEFISKIVPLATGRSKIMSFIGSYHGQTMGAYAMSGHPSQSKFAAGGDIVKVPYPYCHRCAFGKEEGSCELFCLKYIEEYIMSFVCRPEQIGAIIIEAVQCDGGDVVPPDGFLQGLQQICRKYDIILILDEVKIGFGRTGKMFGFENWDLVPDVVVMGKPLGGGQPLSAVVGRKEIMDAAVSAHLFTTAGNPVACASALETIKIIEDENLKDNARLMGNLLIDSFLKLKEKYEIISDVRGKGLVIGIELNKRGRAKEPADEAAALTVYRSYELGLLYYYAGVFNNVLEFTPPLMIREEQVKTAVQIIDQALSDVSEGKVSIEKLTAFGGWG